MANTPDVLKRLEERAAAAIKRITDGHGCLRVPADPTDPDLVISDLIRLARAMLESQGGACWLIWSNYHRAYWGPNGGGYSDVAGAGRYTLSEALSWAEQRSVDPNDPRSNPPELVVPAPEFIARAERIRKREV